MAKKKIPSLRDFMAEEETARAKRERQLQKNLGKLPKAVRESILHEPRLTEGGHLPPSEPLTIHGVENPEIVPDKGDESFAYKTKGFGRERHSYSGQPGPHPSPSPDAISDEPSHIWHLDGRRISL